MTMHASLTPKNNLRLLAIWAVACIIIGVYFTRPMLWVFFGTGALLGGGAGFLQLQALRKSGPQLIAAASAMDVRRALQATNWGKMYLVAFWVGNLAIIVLAFEVYHDGMVAGWIAGYCSLALVREIITLPGTYELQRLENPTAGRAA